MNVYEFLKGPSPEIYRKAHITLDCETTNLNYGDSTKHSNRLLLSSYTDGHSPVRNIWGGLGSTELDEFISLLENLDGFLVGHNIKFDLRWLARHGLDLSKVVVWDTMIAEHVFYGNRSPTIALGLGKVAQRYGYSGKEPFIDICIRSGICPSDLPHSLVERRCGYDVGVTEGVFKQQIKRAMAEGKLATILTRCLLTPVLADIETKGLKLDEDKVNAEYFRAIKEQTEIAKNLSAIADINWNSGKQVGELLYDKLGFKELQGKDKAAIRTATGRPKADVATIRNLTARTKAQKELKEMLSRRSIIEAQLTKTLSKFKACIDNGDLLYAQFNQAITQTHRLSSSGTEYGVQFQNMPRIFKPCVTSRFEGWDVCEADGAQLEFRVAAFLGQDEQAIYDIENGVDIHQFTADTITAAGEPTERQAAKADTFKPLFGGRSGTKAQKAYYAEFKKKYSGVAAKQEEWKNDAIRNKKFRIPSGLEFFFPRIKAPRNADGWIPEESNIYNYPIQSFATADIIPIAIVYTWHNMQAAELNSFIFNTVHDSVIIERHPEEKEKLDEIILDAFGTSCYNYLNEVYNVQFNVPLGCGIKSGSNWGTGHEVKHTLPTPFKRL
jgi:DNA polymerase I-like protein with 3'-5' exonuclease and polymerase domains